MSAILEQMRAILRNHSDALLSCSSCVVLYLLVCWIYIFRVPSAEAVEAGEPGHPYISGKMEAAPLSMALPDYWTNTVSMLLFGGTTLVALVQVTGCHRRHHHLLHRHTSTSPPPHLPHHPRDAEPRPATRRVGHGRQDRPLRQDGLAVQLGAPRRPPLRQLLVP